MIPPHDHTSAIALRVASFAAAASVIEHAQHMHHVLDEIASLAHALPPDHFTTLENLVLEAQREINQVELRLVNLRRAADEALIPEKRPVAKTEMEKKPEAPGREMLLQALR